MLNLRASLGSVIRVVQTTTRNAVSDDLAGEAAEMAFFAFLSLFPILLVIFALTGIVGGEAAFARVTAVVQPAVPGSVWQFVRELIREITERPRPGLLSAGILLTAWAASNGIAALAKGLNAIDEVKEDRPWWKRRLLALAVLVIGLIVAVCAATILVAGTRWVRDAGLGAVARASRWPLLVLLLVGAAWLAYSYLPVRRTRGAWLQRLIGAIAATTLWALVTLLFRFYLSNFGQYTRTYGAIGAIIALLIWMYISAFAVLAGAELAAAIRSGGRVREEKR